MLAEKETKIYTVKKFYFLYNIIITEISLRLEIRNMIWLLINWVKLGN